MRDNEKIQSRSQKTDDGEFAKRIGSEDEDLGSRTVLADTEHVVWYPAEVNTSIRPGWFYHAAEDTQVKSADELMEIYERIVDGNAAFLLNLPPDIMPIPRNRSKENPHHYYRIKMASDD